MCPVRFAEEQEADEKRIRKEIETKMIAEKLKAEEDKKQREKDEAAAVERWKAREAEKAAKEKREKEEAEREYTHRLTDQLRASGLPEDQIKAILEKRRINQGLGGHPRPFPGPPPPPPMMRPVPPQQQQMTTQMTTKTTYTRMARRHLSLECLKVRGIDYELDAVSHRPLARVFKPRYNPHTPPPLPICQADGQDKADTYHDTEPRLRAHQALGASRGAEGSVDADQGDPRRAREGHDDARHRGPRSPPPPPQVGRQPGRGKEDQAGALQVPERLHPHVPGRRQVMKPGLRCGGRLPPVGFTRSVLFLQRRCLTLSSST